MAVVEGALSPLRLTGPSSPASLTKKTPRPYLLSNHRDTEVCNFRLQIADCEIC